MAAILKLFCLARKNDVYFKLGALILLFNIHFNAFAQKATSKKLHPKKANQAGRMLPKGYSSAMKLQISPDMKNTAISNCSCFVPLDSSFSVVPFSNDYLGTPLSPDYRNDDGYTDPINIPFNFCFYGQNKTSLYINNNGNISFDTYNETFTADSFPSTNFSIVAPFWGDVDTRNPTCGVVYYKITSTYMIVKWDSVDYFDSDPFNSLHIPLYNSFQLIITDGSDPVLPAGNNVAFCYGDMQWTTGDASNGVDGFTGYPATVGANQGNGTDFIQFGRFDSSGTSYSGPFPVGPPYEGISWLDNKSFVFSTCSNTNIPPVLDGLSLCDTIKVCVGDTFPQTVTFFSPEINQSTAASVSAPGLLNFNIISNTSGNTAVITTQLIADIANYGYNTITFSGTDNGSPAQTTSATLIIQIDTFALPHPVVTGDSEYCAGKFVTLATSFGYDSTVWSNGSNTQTINNITQGTYIVTAYYNDCSIKSAPFIVTENPNPAPVITGVLFTCGSDSALLKDVSLADTAYLWSNGSKDSAIFVSNGTYSVMVIDSNGCIGTSASVTVTSSPKPLADFSFTPPSPVFPDKIITFTDLSAITGGSITSWYWIFGDDSVSTSRDTTHSYSQPGTYTICLVAKTIDGCTDTICKEYVIKPYDIDVPNIFTPNGDGFNDYFVFRNLEFFPNSQLLVYNRWGQKLFESNDYDNKWNGGKVSDGVYYFILNLSDGNSKHGTVTIIR